MKQDATQGTRKARNSRAAFIDPPGAPRFPSRPARNILAPLLAGLILTGALLSLAGCGAANAGASKVKTYAIRAEGVAAESGVVCYAGLEMNIYRDFASNPCGDCEDQPVSVYAGATAEEVIAAMAEAVTRADDLWAVKTVDGDLLVLEEKTPGGVREEPELSSVDGLTLTGEFEG